MAKIKQKHEVGALHIFISNALNTFAKPVILKPKKKKTISKPLSINFCMHAFSCGFPIYGKNISITLLEFLILAMKSDWQFMSEISKNLI